MRILFFLLLSSPALASEALLMAEAKDGEPIEITDEIKNQCIIGYAQAKDGEGKEESIINCSAVTSGPLAGAFYEKNVAASADNGGDAVFTCSTGCGVSTPKKLWYMAIDPGC